MEGSELRTVVGRKRRRRREGRTHCMMRKFGTIMTICFCEGKRARSAPLYASNEAEGRSTNLHAVHHAVHLSWVAHRVGRHAGRRPRSIEQGVAVFVELRLDLHVRTLEKSGAEGRGERRVDPRGQGGVCGRGAKELRAEESAPDCSDAVDRVVVSSRRGGELSYRREVWTHCSLTAAFVCFLTGPFSSSIT